MSPLADRNGSPCGCLSVVTGTASCCRCVLQYHRLPPRPVRSDRGRCPCLSLPRPSSDWRRPVRPRSSVSAAADERSSSDACPDDQRAHNEHQNVTRQSVFFFDLPRCLLLNFHILGSCHHVRALYKSKTDHERHCSVDTSPITKFDGSLLRLHEAEDWKSLFTINKV